MRSSNSASNIHHRDSEHNHHQHHSHHHQRAPADSDPAAHSHALDVAPGSFRHDGDTPRSHSDLGTSPSSAAYTPSSLHSFPSQHHTTLSLTEQPRPSHPRAQPAPQPINAVLAALAHSDLPYSGIMRPHDGDSYDQRRHYDPSPEHRDSIRYPQSTSSNNSRPDDRDRDVLDLGRHSNFSPLHGRYPAASSSQSNMHGLGSAAATAPGSQDHSPPNPASHHYDPATPPQPQGYRPYLASPSTAAAASNAGRNGSSSSNGAAAAAAAAADVRNASGKRAHDNRDFSESPGDRPRQPWPEQYRQKPSTAESTPASTTKTSANDASEPPSKKRRKAKAAPNQDIPETAEVEYEDPGGDRTRGPVFVHPPKGAVQACIRCHRIKRKCDGAWPRCASCARVDVACVFELSAATSSYVHKLKKTNADLLGDLRASQARIHALELQLAADDKGTGAASHALSNSEFGRLAISGVTIREHVPLDFLGGAVAISGPDSPPPPSGARGRVNSFGMLSTHSRDSGHGPHLFLADLLTRDDALKAADHFFDFNGVAYPILERRDFIHDLLDVYDTEKERERDRQNQAVSDRMPEFEDAEERTKFIIYLVLAIGKGHAVRLGDDHSHRVSKALYNQSLRYRAKALCKEDMLCIRALILLTLFYIELPETGPPWQSLGLAGRVAMAIGLNRRSDSHVPMVVAESRRRLFYAFYNLDRWIAAVFSKPLTIAEHDIDIDLPTDQPSDPPYRGWPIMHFHRYNVRYRRLLGCTLTALYSVNGEQNALPEPERRAIIVRLHEELEAWAADGTTFKDDFTMRRMNHNKLLEISYHCMLCMLYRPSPLYPDTTPATLRALYSASSKCVDLYCELWTVNQVSFNLIQIVGLFVSCICLLCCLCECDTRMHSAEVAGRATTAATLAELGLPYTGVDDPAWAAEIRSRVAQCRDLFQTFGRGTPLSAKYRDIFTRISELLLARYGPLHRDADAQPAAEDAKPPVALAIAATVRDSSALMTPVSGSSALTADGGGDTSLAPAGSANTALHGPNSAAGPNVAGGIAGAWDAMMQLWFDLGDLFSDDTADNMGLALPPIGGADGLQLPGPGALASPGALAGGGSGMPGLPPSVGVGVVPPSLSAADVGGGYPALNYPTAAGVNPYGHQPYAAYAASYPGPYGPYGEGGFEDSWAEHWRPEGEGWWGHI